MKSAVLDCVMCVVDVSAGRTPGPVCTHGGHHDEEVRNESARRRNGSLICCNWTIRLTMSFRPPCARILRCSVAPPFSPGSDGVRGRPTQGRASGEVATISKELLALGNVISAATAHLTKHVPYRDSLLTRILQVRGKGGGRSACGCFRLGSCVSPMFRAYSQEL